MLGQALVIVSDAHLGVTPPSIEEALLDFLDCVPDLGDCLLVNGDLFDFWFGYSRVIPRRGFHVAAALAALARQLPVVMVGGNHDRWGNGFWDGDLGIRFARDSVEFSIGSRRVLAIHGDGLNEPSRRSQVVHRIIMHPLTAAVYRALHPEIGLRLVDRLAPALGDHAPDPARIALAATRQREWAEARLAREPGLGLIVMGHTHRPALLEPSPGRQYLNPGAWFDGFRYAVATGESAELREFSPKPPLRPFPAARR